MAFVQAGSAYTPTNATTLTSSGVTTTSGNILLMGSWLNSTSITLTTPTDSYGNTWQPLFAALSTTSGYLYGWYSQNITGGAGHTITSALSSGAGQEWAFSFAEYSGRDTGIPLDSSGPVTANRNGNYVTNHSGANAGAAVTTTTTGCDLFAYATSAGASVADTFTTNGGGWTFGGEYLGNGSTQSPSFMAYLNNQVNATYTLTWTTGNAVNPASFIVGLIPQRTASPLPPAPKQTFVNTVIIQY